MQLVGSQLGDYHLLQQIGAGGMGEVYLAEDPRIGHQVALKVIRIESFSPDPSVAEKAIRLFRREAKALANLTHPHILPLHHYGEEVMQGTRLLYIVMPLCHEGSLETWVQQRNALSPEELTPLLLQAAEALQYAHDKQIIHCDIKPANFLLRSRRDSTVPDLLLADFGIAAIMNATTSAEIRGTPAYMAPEQWEGHPVPATDQYALAVMAYNLLTGHTLFTGNEHQLMYNHLYSQPQPPSTLNPRISQDIDAVILKALEKNPEDRFPSVLVFAQAFQEALGGDEVSSTAKISMASGNEYIGKVIGNYRIVQLVSSGAFGSVYLAEHTILTGRIVAIKLLHSALAGSQKLELDRFLQEARLLEKLRHPYILATLDAGVYEISPDGSIPYIMTEYAPNGSLRDRIRRRYPDLIPLSEVLTILSQIGQGLQYMHQQKIIHRDLKPENILFNANEEALLTDIGIVIIADIEPDEHALGTPAYMAPEQFQGKFSRKSDQYSLGCIAYELITGRVPVSGRSIEQVQNKHLYELPIAPRQLNPQLPVHIEQAILKAMAKNPEDRHRNVAAFISALYSSHKTKEEWLEEGNVHYRAKDPSRNNIVN